jgi:hypothetical protein
MGPAYAYPSGRWNEVPKKDQGTWCHTLVLPVSSKPYFSWRLDVPSASLRAGSWRLGGPVS